VPGNTIGTLFRVTTFGESHGAAVGAVVDGCPAGVELRVEGIQAALDRRRPGQSEVTSERNEADTVQIMSGVFEGKTLGTPIALLAFNQDSRPEDYAHLKDIYRPSHADFTTEKKYGVRDYRGGGRSSARETWARVAAGAVAASLLKQLHGIEIIAFVSQVHSVRADVSGAGLSRADVDATAVRCPDLAAAEKMERAILEAKASGDSLGGVISCVVSGTPIGLGEPVFDKLSARLASAMMSINATKGFEYGLGFRATELKGSEHNDAFRSKGTGRVQQETNRAGGILGGMSSGELITFNVAFKPTSTIAKPQSTTDKDGNELTLEVKGRHDPCVLPRAVPIVEAMAALTLADLMLIARGTKSLLVD